MSSEIVRDEDPLLVHGVLRAAVEDDVDKLKSLVRRGKRLTLMIVVVTHRCTSL